MKLKKKKVLTITSQSFPIECEWTVFPKTLTSFKYSKPNLSPIRYLTSVENPKSVTISLWHSKKRLSYFSLCLFLSSNFHFSHAWFVYFCSTPLIGTVFLSQSWSPCRKGDFFFPQFSFIFLVTKLHFWMFGNVFCLGNGWFLMQVGSFSCYRQEIPNFFLMCLSLIGEEWILNF